MNRRCDPGPVARLDVTSRMHVAKFDAQRREQPGTFRGACPWCGRYGRMQLREQSLTPACVVCTPVLRERWELTPSGEAAISLGQPVGAP